MSNLYKQRFVVADSEHTRIINSNALVEQKLEQLTKQQNAKKQEMDEDGFVSGLNIEAVEVVPKEESISIEEILEQKKTEAEEILNQAKAEAEALIEKAKSQADSVRKQAQDEGYDKGLQEGKEQAQQELNQLRKQLEEEQKQLQEAYQKQLQELEPRLVDVIADVFEKVFHVQFDDKKEILLYLIQNTILDVEGAKEFLVKVSTEDFAFLESHLDEIAQRAGKSVTVEIAADTAMQKGQCVIETDSGVFDCGIDIQLENLIKALRSLSLR